MARPLGVKRPLGSHTHNTFPAVLERTQKTPGGLLADGPVCTVRACGWLCPLSLEGGGGGCERERQKERESILLGNDARSLRLLSLLCARVIRLHEIWAPLHDMPWHIPLWFESGHGVPESSLSRPIYLIRPLPPLVSPREEA